MASAGGPDDFEDVRNALRLLGIQWRTEERLGRFHSLAERSLFAAEQILGAFSLADTPNALPGETIELWLSHLLQTAVETVLFPDPLPTGATTWEALRAIWDDHISYAREFHLTGVRVICEGDAWSIRRAVKAAWNIEFSSVGRPVEIGPTSADSAHRLVLRTVADLWIEYSTYADQAVDDPAKRAQLWDAFAARWIDYKVTQQRDRVRAMLPSELADLRQRLGFAPKPSSDGATATASAHASVGNAVKATRSRRRRVNRRNATSAQVEALKVVGECGNNFAEAGRRLKKNPKTVRQLYKAGLKNAGSLASKLTGKLKFQQMPLDARGQPNVSKNGL